MRRLLLAAVLSLPWGVMAACDEAELGESIPAQEGIVQPQGNAAAIDEQTACSRIVAAEQQARARMGCPQPEAPPVCPAYVRPAGTRVCLMYDEGTVVACEGIIGNYESCEDFDRAPCVITALDEPAQGCDLGVAGAAGVGGAAGAAGTTAAGAAGVGGAAAEAGSAGAAGRATAGAPASTAGGAGQTAGGGAGGAGLATAGTAGSST